MPKKTITDYVFYKIVCDDCPDYIYIGSTSNFRDRKSGHKRSCNNPNEKNHNIKLYQVIREYGGWTNWNMVVIDKAEQLTLTDSRIKEEQLRKEYNGNLNMCRAFRSDEEKKADKKILNKEYREKNKEIIVEKGKEYNELNRDKISERMKEYREKNKEIIVEKQKEKITCICGCKITKHNLNRHIKNDKHINLMKLQNQEN